MSTIRVGDFVRFAARTDVDETWRTRSGKVYLVTYISPNGEFGTEYALIGLEPNEHRLGGRPDEFYAKAERLTVVPRPVAP